MPAALGGGKATLCCKVRLGGYTEAGKEQILPHPCWVQTIAEQACIAWVKILAARHIGCPLPLRQGGIRCVGVPHSIRPHAFMHCWQQARNDNLRGWQGRREAARWDAALWSVQWLEEEQAHPKRAARQPVMPL